MERRQQFALAGVLASTLALATQAWALPHHSVQLFLSEERWGALSDRDSKPELWDGEGGDRYSDWKHEEGPKWLAGKDFEKLRKFQEYKYDKDGKDYGADKHHKYPKYDDPDCEPPLSTPEPTTLLLFGASVGGLAAAKRWRHR